MELAFTFRNETRGISLCAGEHAAIRIIGNFHDRRKVCYQISAIVHGQISAEINRPLPLEAAEVGYCAWCAGGRR